MPVACSSRTSTTDLAEDCKNECANVVGIATTRPKTVVTRACDIPPAIIFGSPVPNNVICWKVIIIPVTVPNRPASGATTDTIFTKLIPFQ